MLCSRFIGFQESLSKTDKFPVKFLASLCQTDQRTVFGRTLRRISLECSSPLGQLPSKTLVKKVMKFSQVPEAESWRLGLLNNLLDIRCSRAVLPGFTSTEDEDLIIMANLNSPIIKWRSLLCSILALQTILLNSAFNPSTPSLRNVCSDQLILATR